MEKLKGTWDRRLNYEATFSKLKDALDKAESKKSKAYIQILLIQLVNGGRISEAVDAYEQFLKTNERKVYVRVRKRNVERIMFIPDFIEPIELDFSDKKKLRNRIIVYSLEKFNHNTHSLRHGFVTYMVFEKNMNPAVVGKIIGHKNLSHLLTYISSLVAERSLEDHVRKVEKSG